MRWWRPTLARLGVRTDTGRDAVAAGLLAIVLVLVPLVLYVVVSTRQPEPVPGAPLLLAASAAVTLAGCGTIAARRRWPRAALMTATGLVLACAALSVTAPGPAVGLVVAAYTVATLLPWRRRAPVLVACLLAHLVGGVLIARAGGDPGDLPTFWGVPGQDLDAMLSATLASYGLPVLVGSLVRTRRAYTAELIARAECLEAEREQRDRRAAAEERTRIARELHDIAAHDLSAIVVQAGAADRLVDGNPVAAKVTLHAIRKQGRETLDALRQLVGIMREDDADGRAPQPSLARLGELADGARSAGTAVEVVARGTPEPLPAGVDLAAYRVVQEALTNARRHAPGAPVTVTLVYDHGVRVVVRNATPDRHATSASPWPSPAGATPEGARPGPPAGHGLVGMRERVQQAGGTLAAGPTGDGGWQVDVRLPRQRDPA